MIEQTPDGPTAGPWRTVVGVSADVRQAYGDPQLSDVYTPLIPAGRFGSFYIRTDRPPSALLPTIRSIAAEIDPHAMVGPLRAVESENRQLAGTRFLTALLGGLAVVAAFLAVLGIYGVTAYTVQQRERETAIRMAIGATSSVVVRMFVVESAVLLIAGLILGLLGAAAVSRILESQLFGVRRFDVPTLAITCVGLAAAGVLAAWWPARRASRRHPVAVLKDV